MCWHPRRCETERSVLLTVPSSCQEAVSVLVVVSDQLAPWPMEDEVIEVSRLSDRSVPESRSAAD